MRSSHTSAHLQKKSTCFLSWTSPLSHLSQMLEPPCHLQDSTLKWCARNLRGSSRRTAALQQQHTSTWWDSNPFEQQSTHQRERDLWRLRVARSGSAPLRSLRKVDQPKIFFHSHADAMSPQCWICLRLINTHSLQLQLYRGPSN